MKTFFSWCLKPAVLALLGVLLLAWIIWFKAPLLSFDGDVPFGSARVRAMFIGIACGLWALYFGASKALAWLARRREAKRLAAADASAQQAPAMHDDAELAELDLRMRHALSFLRKSRKDGRRGVYQLPWYLLIGAPESGKTCALARSGLQFALAERKDTPGASTGHCDWWFADQAVLLDTPGRYTDRDADQAGWTALLHLLRKYRKRRPVNGVIVALSVADLLHETAGARADQARSLRARIRQLHDQLGGRVPVYVLVTKCDLLAGFDAYFELAGPEEREQVWGTTFSLDGAQAGEAALAAFPAEFRLLERQLQARLIERMQQERDVDKRALIYGFPLQFARLREILDAFLGDVFEANRYEKPALLRGVYFSSAPQAGRAYFLTRLLKELVFPEAELAGVDRAHERGRRFLQWGAVACIALLSLTLGVGMAASYVRNNSLVSATAAASAQLAARVAGLPAQGPAAQLLPALDAARTLATGVDDGDRPVPWLMRFGMYQGDRLDEAGRATYRTLLRDTLLPRITERLEEQLRRGQGGAVDTLYDTLRVYLMLGDAQHFDADWLAGWSGADDELSMTAPGDGLRRAALGTHEQALMNSLREGTAMPRLDSRLVADTRLALARVPLPARLYEGLKRELMGSALPEFSATSAAGPGAASLLVRRSGEPVTRGVNGMFTVAGHAAFLDLSRVAIAELRKEHWIMAQQEAVTVATDGEQVRQAILQLYYDDYIDQWQALLDDVTVAPFSTLEQAARGSKALAAADSPLRKFIIAASRETAPGSAMPVAAPGTLTVALQGKIAAYKKRVQGALGGAAAAPAVARAVHPVDAHFDALHKLTAGKPAALEQSLAMLGEVALYLDAAASARQNGTPPPPAGALSKVRLEGEAVPAPLQDVLKQIDASGTGLTAGSERERLNALWSAGAGPYCRQAASGRYPIVRGAVAEILPENFAKLFGPAGLIDDFFQKNLLQHVDMSASRWRWRTSSASSALGMTQATLDTFQRAALIRDAWFADGERLASLRFDLRTEALDPGIGKPVLSIDGQQLVATPASVASFQLPSGKDNGKVRLESAAGNVQAGLQRDGSWAWLRMLDQAVVTPTPQAERFKVTFNLDGKKVAFDMTASSVVNPFRRAPLEQFRCMDTL
jgi:type VI secretion system protein ImpL